MKRTRKKHNAVKAAVEKVNRMKRVPALVISREDVRFAADSLRRCS